MVDARDWSRNHQSVQSVASGPLKSDTDMRFFRRLAEARQLHEYRGIILDEEDFMQLTDVLMNEHRVIEQVLQCLDVIAERARRSGRVDQDLAGRALDFLRHFADGCHHAKEEKHLFPLMEAKGFSRQFGPTGVMLDEHTLGRSFVQGMLSQLPAAAAGDQAAVAAFVQHARDYGGLLRQHIAKEDHCLFPMANSVFTPADQARLLSSFQNVEAHDAGPGQHEHYLGIASRLLQDCGVSFTPANPGHKGLACCGHGH
jgi:hemerythrin-like domain-containing protein